VARHLALHFIAMTRKEIPAQLDVWIRQARQCGVSEPSRFADGLERDYDAVPAALTTTYSNGLAEGHINRLKMLRRQMYGRAGLPLLKIRMLHGDHQQNRTRSQKVRKSQFTVADDTLTPVMKWLHYAGD
jgi:transposase